MESEDRCHYHLLVLYNIFDLKEGYMNDFARVVLSVEGKEKVLQIKPHLYDLK